MFRTIISKIGLLVAAALVLTAAALAISSKFTVEAEMLRFEKRMIANILQVTVLEINKDFQAIQEYRRQTMEARKRDLQHVGQAVRSALDGFADLADQKILTKRQAQEAAKDYIRNFRFGNSDYFYAYDLDFTNIAHPRRNLEGKNLYDLQDDHGNFVCHELRRIAVEEKEGFSQLRFPRLNATDWAPKSFYVFLYPRWSWIVGSGVYIDDIDDEVQEKMQSVIHRLQDTLSEINLVDGGGSIFIFDSNNKIITPPSREIREALNRLPEKGHDGLYERLKQKAVDLDNLLQIEEAGRDSEEFRAISFEAPDPNARGETRNIIAFSTHYAPLGWYIVGEVPREYVLKPAEKMIRSEMSATLVVLLLSILASVLVVRRILRPMARLTEIAQQIAAGDLKSAQASLNYLGRDKRGFSQETSRLHQSFVHMVKSLSELARQIKKSQYQVAASATEISASARQSADMVQAQADASSQANETSQRISATVEELAISMNQATEAASETANLADANRKSLTSMEEAMREVHTASNSIADKLGAINETTSNIGAITTAITKISEQTNMLSLNAAIEAEKAGEYGRGFSVVAREIRRLSDQTAKEVLNIEKMVGNVRSAVSSGVMEVEGFSHQVQKGADQVKELGGRLDQIIDRVLELAPGFEEVNRAMTAQASGADQIRSIMGGLAQASSSSAESLQEFRLAAEQLNEAVQGLQTQLSGFKLDE
ncbi:MAG: methyl-accepting chemotaxis protein [Desulfovibrionales bacterium]|nr:methyl-accepting chemotaxis protein [Desulfovibrionales bacterium]